MKQLAWNPAWVQPFESFGSISTKIGFLSTASVQDIVTVLIGASGTSRRSLWLPDAQALLACCDLLGIDSKQAGDHVFRVGAPALPERASMRLALRWCPECLLDHYHSALFQDQLRTRCPWHGAPLLEACPFCTSPVDPLRLDGWRCSRCQTPLVEPPKGWLRSFKVVLDRSLAQDRIAGSIGLSSTGINADGSLALACRDAQAHGADDWADRHEYEERWIQWLAFEELSALSDAILGQHSHCLGSEWPASRLEFTPTRFECPGAAAITNAMAWVGVKPQELGGWLDVARRSGDQFGIILQAALTHPRWLVPFVVREIVRSWVLDALRAYSSAALSGQYFVEWRPPASAIVVNEVNRDSAVLVPQVDDDALKAAACKANAVCRCRSEGGPFALWKRYREVEKPGIV